MRNYYYHKSVYLAHYGVQGMRWGVRRYQNKDGSLTNAGKKRYSEDKITRMDEHNRRIKKFKKFSEKTTKVAAGMAGIGLASVMAASAAAKKMLEHPEAITKLQVNAVVNLAYVGDLLRYGSLGAFAVSGISKILAAGESNRRLYTVSSMTDKEREAYAKKLNKR